MKIHKKYRSRIFNLFLLCQIILFGIESTFAQLTILPITQRSTNSFVSTTTPPEFIIINNSVATVNVSAEVSVQNDNFEIATYSCSKMELSQGQNLSTNFNFISNTGSINEFYSPNQYRIKVTLRNPTETSIILEQTEFPLNINMGSIICLNPIDNSTQSSPFQFCYSIPGQITNQPIKIYLWDGIENMANHVANFEIPPLYEFQTTENCIYYPIEGPQLQEDKKYIWQARLYSDSKLIASSPINSFTYKNNKPRKKGDDYRLVTTKVNTGQYLYGSYLRFAFNNRFNEKILNYKMEDLSKGKAIKNAPEIKLNSGLNSIDIDLLGVPGLIYGHMYRMVINDRNNDNYIIQFSFDRLK